MDGLVPLISNVGFPIAITLFLLWKLLPAIDAIANAVDKMTSSMQQIDRTMLENGLHAREMRASIDRLNDSVNFLRTKTPQQRMGDQDDIR